MPHSLEDSISSEYVRGVPSTSLSQAVFTASARTSVILFEPVLVITGTLNAFFSPEISVNPVILIVPEEPVPDRAIVSIAGVPEVSTSNAILIALLRVNLFISLV